MNQQSAYQILQQLAQNGVSTLCVCPGARNAPFIQILENQQTPFEVLSFYDERSAGFFALGRAQRDQKPVAIFTTSGTAVSELLSPLIEAYYTKTPLVIVSADRPKRLRGTGAPQAIEQAHLFGVYVDKCWDISAGEPLLLPSIDRSIQINICFDEPLVDSFKIIESIEIKSDENSEKVPFVVEPQRLEKPLFVIGGLSKADRPFVEKALTQLEGPVFAEAASGLNDSSQLSSRLIRGGERIVSQMLKSGEVRTVVRLGDVPLGRYWRDLDLLDIRTLSLNDKKFAGTERSEIFVGALQSLDFREWTSDPWGWQKWQKRGEEQAQKVDSLLETYPLSEPAQFSRLAKVIATEESLYIGNSLPVRLWDLVSRCTHNIKASRGANGIDGQTSTALGAAHPGKMNWVILGDLTTLYDFNGLWLTSYLKTKKISVNLVVMNNGGGQIFSRIFKEELFRNNHNLNFKPVAEMWGWDYLKIDEVSAVWPKEGLNLIEVCPDSMQSQKFWNEYDSQWQK